MAWRPVTPAELEQKTPRVDPFVHGIAVVLLSEKHVAYIDRSGKTVFDYFRR